MFKYRLQNFIRLAIALLIALFVCLFVKVGNVQKLSVLNGEPVFYLRSASSNSLMKTELNLSDLYKVKGESVSIVLEENRGDRYAVSEEIARFLAKKFDAKILLQESFSDVISYYCYTPRWQTSIFVRGYTVNLHIAVSKDYVVVGTPIIFGGF